MDIARLKSSFARIAMHGDEVPLHFYSDLFLKHPETRPMFPVSMQAQRAHLVDALLSIVSSVDNLDNLTVFLRDLGRGHRKFGTLAEHYEAVGASLLATFAHFCGEAWDAELEADWRDAYELIAGVMTAAALEDEQHYPATWTGTVVAAERRAFDVAILTVRTQPRLEYLPGQSVAIESPARPRLWRYYSMANAPRQDGSVEFHVRLIDGGAVSMALTSGTTTGAEVKLGPPVGVLRLDTASGRDILMVARSTGLAPLKAMLEQAAGLRQPPRVLTGRPDPTACMTCQPGKMAAEQLADGRTVAPGPVRRPDRLAHRRRHRWDMTTTTPTRTDRDSAGHRLTASSSRNAGRSDTRRGFWLE